MGANTASISYYTRVSDIDSDKTIPVDIFFDAIKDGKWKDFSEQVRAISNKEERDAKKKQAPSVTISGKFKKREDNSIEKHSGLIGIDIDDVEDINGLKQIICCDKYVVAAFTSISGKGLCVVFRINPAKHREAFQGISEYLFSNYQIVVDPTSVNPSRARFISYDPEIFINQSEAEKFTEYPKAKPPKKVEKIIYSGGDFEELLNQLQSRHLNICENYHEWLRIAFGLVHQFGEGGRQYFHQISQYSTKYDSFAADRQYSACVKHKGSNTTTIATFYYYCKQAGLELYSERTKKIAYTTSQGKKGGLTKEAVAANLEKYEEITGAEDIINQVWDNNIEVREDSVIEQLEMYIRQNYNLRRNEVTRYIENDGKIFKGSDFNSIYIKAKKIFPNLSFDLVDRLINSDFIPDYNPFFEFFEQYKEMETIGNIDKVLSSIQNIDPNYCRYFGKKWIVGIIAAIHGEINPLQFVLSGEKHGTGKTEWFRRLWPKEWKPYYAESKMDAGKDDFILMTQRICIMDDELGGKSKKESRFMKDLSSKDYFDLREPYGRTNVTLKRLATLCGTSNDRDILGDPTGNRRVIPIIVNSVDKRLYNSVNKTALWMEAYRLYKDGFDWTVLTDEDVAYLRQDETLFEVRTTEGELLLKYYELPGPSQVYTLLTATDIKVYLELHTRQRLSLVTIGQQMQKLGFEQVHKKVGKTTARYYKVVIVDGLINPETPEERLPF